MSSTTLRPLRRGQREQRDYPAITVYEGKYRRLAYLNAPAQRETRSIYLRWLIDDADPDVVVLEALTHRTDDAYKLHDNGLIGVPVEIHERMAGHTYRLESGSVGMILLLDQPLDAF